MRSSPHTAAVINQQLHIAVFQTIIFLMPFAQVAETLYFFSLPSHPS